MISRVISVRTSYSNLLSLWLRARVFTTSCPVQYYYFIYISDLSSLIYTSLRFQRLTSGHPTYGCQFVNKPTAHSRRMRRSRHERASGSDTSTNRVIPSNRVEAHKPQVGMTYRQIFTDLQTIAFGSAATASFSPTYSPSAAMLALFDEYFIKSVNVRFHYTTDTFEKVSNGTPLAIAFDPSLGTIPMSYQALLAYRNSADMFLSINRPIYEYSIRNCTHLSSDSVTLLTEPIKTDSSWSIGRLMVSPLVFSSSFNVNCVLEYEVVFSKPRSA
jgi:hypothetical protein